MAGEGRTLTPDEMVDYLAELADDYPIASIEDGMAEDDMAGWKALTERLGDRVQLVGDDLFVTNEKRLADGIARRHRQFDPGQGQPDRHADRDHRRGPPRAELGLYRGDVAPLGRDRGFDHRRPRGRAVCGQIKTGSLARSDRTAKYNQLLRIEEELGDSARYPGGAALRPTSPR